MVIKIVLLLAFVTGLKFLYSSFGKSDATTEGPIDEMWWNGLSDEWKTIFIINQNFQKQQVDIFKLQNEYINRLNAVGENDHSEMNTSLYRFDAEKRFSLGYADLHARAIRKNHIIKNDRIDLTTLASLDTIYMVNGPGDLTPLLKFPHLKVLIINDCGIDNTIPVREQLLDLAALKYLKELKVLHCSSRALQSFAPLKNVVSLEELHCTNSGVTSLAPLKKLVNLRALSLGSQVTDMSIIPSFKNLESLYFSGAKRIPNLSRLKKLKKLCLVESELSIVNSSYRISDIRFMKDLAALEFLDVDYTSYKGSLDELNPLQNLKAIALPPVNSSKMLEFKKEHIDCIIINAFQFERY